MVQRFNSVVYKLVHLGSLAKKYVKKFWGERGFARAFISSSWQLRPTTSNLLPHVRRRGYIVYPRFLLTSNFSVHFYTSVLFLDTLNDLIWINRIESSKHLSDSEKFSQKNSFSKEILKLIYKTFSFQTAVTFDLRFRISYEDLSPKTSYTLPKSTFTAVEPEKFAKAKQRASQLRLLLSLV